MWENSTPLFVDIIGAIFAPLALVAYYLYELGYPDWAVAGLVVFQVLDWLSLRGCRSRKSS